MRAADLQIELLDFPQQDPHAVKPLEPRAALKHQVAERLAAHRLRRSQGAATPIPVAEPRPVKVRANRIASTVAERYAQTQSYRDFLAAEAARAMEAANAAAEVAARNAVAVTVAQQQLLAELDNWNEPQLEAEHGASPALLSHGVRWAHKRPEESFTISVQPEPLPPNPAPLQHPIAGLTVRLYEDAGITPPLLNPTSRANQTALASAAPDEEENFLLDDEIAFRQTPVFAAPAGPTVPIPANLIEFPRQLVAPRKARPRIAEGPLREEADAAPRPRNSASSKSSPTRSPPRPTPESRSLHPSGRLSISTPLTKPPLQKRRKSYRRSCHLQPLP